MDAQAELQFLAKLLEKLHIPCCRFMPDAPPFSNAALHALAGYGEIVRHAFETTRPCTIYMARDAFSFNYIYLLLPDTGEILMVGPYLLEKISEMQIMQTLETLRLPAAHYPSVRKYISNLPVLREETMLITALCTLGEQLWGGAGAFDVERAGPSPILPFADPADAASSKTLMEASDFRIMEERYKAENQLMHLIAQGHTHRAQMIVSQMNEYVVESRSADRLRSLKHYSIVFNTLARKAAEEGGVHPLYIDRLSAQMALRIENARTVEECGAFFPMMVHKYCLLVKNHSMKGYSLLVQHVILRIESDLTADLSLKAHADALSVNASYLSTLFRKETGMTLTEYVSRKRMDHAIFLLNATDMQVQTIAQYCGIPDVNYFTKTFKRIIGKTPKEYRAGAKHGE